jgi:hypothetical protein
MPKPHKMTEYQNKVLEDTYRQEFNGANELFSYAYYDKTYKPAYHSSQAGKIQPGNN